MVPPLTSNLPDRRSDSTARSLSTPPFAVTFLAASSSAVTAEEAGATETNSAATNSAATKRCMRCSREQVWAAERVGPQYKPCERTHQRHSYATLRDSLRGANE